MPRIFLHLAYRGTAYHGWQTQTPDLPTVQSTLEAAMARLLGERVHVHGCGRTDAGVHATHYVAHFDCPKSFAHNDAVRALNRLLPLDIAVHTWQVMPAGAHAQRDASWRAYEYRIGLRPNPFQLDLVGRYDELQLDLNAMQAVVALYAEATDFKSFCRRPTQYPHTRCRIDYCRLVVDEAAGIIRFQIQADRFLQNMVRLLVARMIDVGAERLSLDDIASALAQGRPLKPQRPAYAEGLFLVGVEYG